MTATSRVPADHPPSWTASACVFSQHPTLPPVIALTQSFGSPPVNLSENGLSFRESPTFEQVRVRKDVV